MSLLEFVDPKFLIDRLDLSVTGLRDALRGVANKTLSDLETHLAGIVGDTPALNDATVTGLLKSIGDIGAGENIITRLGTTTDAAVTAGATGSVHGKLRAISRDVNTRLADAKFPSAAALGDAMANPTTTLIGSMLMGFDGTNWERIQTDGSNRLKAQLDALPNPPNLDLAITALRDALLAGTATYPGGLDDIYNKLNAQLDVVLSTRLADTKIPNALAQISKDIGGSSVYALAMIGSGSPMDITRQPTTVKDISVSTTESSTTFSAPGLKLITIVNTGDNDVQLGINASVPVSNPLIVRSRHGSIFPFGGATTIYYKTPTGTSTIDIKGWN